MIFFARSYPSFALRCPAKLKGSLQTAVARFSQPMHVRQTRDSVSTSPPLNQASKRPDRLGLDPNEQTSAKTRHLTGHLTLLATGDVT